MSTEFYAIGILGCVIPRDRLYDCEWLSHAELTGHPATDMPFCGMCGRKNELHIIEVARWQENTTIDGFSLQWTHDRQYGYVGEVMQSAWDNDFQPVRMDIGMSNALQDRLQAVLEPLHLWDPALFGFWVVMSISS